MVFIVYVSDVVYVFWVEFLKNEVNNFYYVVDYNWLDVFYIIDRLYFCLLYDVY